MAHSSTTATSSYVLSKYSRSYPTTAQTYSDWKHFTNPEIRLVLDVTKNNGSELQEVRLRVLWNINDASDHQPQVVFEDIELLSFSALATDKIIEKNQQLPGLPIKAVYRDNLVGIRYLHPKDTISLNPTYRRFQVTFASATLANEFINSICTVCPCKLNSGGVPNMNQNQALSRNLLLKTGDPSQLPSRKNVLADPNVSMLPRSTLVSGCLAPPDKPVFQMPLSSPQFSGSSQQEIQLTSSPVNMYLDQLQLSNIQDRSHHHGTGTGLDRSQKCWHLPESQLSLQDRQPPNQSPSSPRRNDDQTEIATDKTRHELLSALQEFQNTELYDLSPNALEEIVGGIVHEKGFPELLKSLEKLWAVRDLARICI